MDGIHDMGGMHGFGTVEPEPNEPVFHADWEGRALALNRAMGYTGIWTIDLSRYGIERLPPDVLSDERPITRTGPCGWRISWSSSDLSAPTRSKRAMRCARASRSNASSPPPTCRTR